MSTTETRPLPPVPSEFEAIGTPLGRGASAVVWRARNRVTGQEVALKVWLNPLRTDEERRQFETESRIHLQVPDHPHIARWLWAAAPVDGPPWLATELHGESLGNILRRDGPYPLGPGLIVALDLLHGLAAMHRRGMVHRDVKPDNVLITAGRAALCDLGVSVLVDEPADDCAAGTRSFLAPELIVGDPRAATFRSDVFAAARTIRQTLGTEVPLMVDLLLTRAQSTDPLDRPGDADDFVVRLATVNADLGFASPPDPGDRSAAGPSATARTAAGPSIPPAPGRRDRPRRTAHRRALIAVVVAAALVMTGAWATAVMLRTSASPAVVPTPTPTADGTAVLAAARVAPDIDGQGRPVLLERRAHSRCVEHSGPDVSVEQRVDGVLAATVTLHRDDQAGTVCAYLHKAGSSNTYGNPSYLSLSLCNDVGDCDSDWFDYVWRAGPVVVNDSGGCTSWRVSMTDVGNTRWILRDAVGKMGC